MEVEEAQEPVLGPAPGPAEVDTAALAALAETTVTS